jgi:hypothetical protein
MIVPGPELPPNASSYFEDSRRGQDVKAQAISPTIGVQGDIEAEARPDGLGPVEGDPRAGRAGRVSAVLDGFA